MALPKQFQVETVERGSGLSTSVTSVSTVSTSTTGASTTDISSADTSRVDTSAARVYTTGTFYTGESATGATVVGASALERFLMYSIVTYNDSTRAAFFNYKYGLFSLAQNALKSILKG